VWQSYWKLGRDPFAADSSPYVALPEHEEAVSRLEQVVASGQHWGWMTGPPGVGKTRGLARALASLRSPARRIAITRDPFDGAELYAKLAEGLGLRLPPGADRGTAWRALERAVRLCGVQNQQVVLAVDGAEALLEGPARQDLLRLGGLGQGLGSRLTILIVGNEGGAAETPSESAWGPAVRLGPLLLADAHRYLEEKLAAAGCRDALFSPRAIVRLHLLSEGTPRGLDRLASLSLRAAASRGMEAVSSELVDAVSAGTPVGVDRHPGSC
jgi:type II secretory pathway predicted ATPase ExeA